MRTLLLASILLTLTLFVPAQTKETVLSMDNERISWPLAKLLQPDTSDKAEAKKLGVKVFRILPREAYEGKIDLRGGGAFYSFVANPGSEPNDLDPPDYVRVPTPLSGGVVAGATQVGTVFTGKQNTNDSLAAKGFKMEQNQDPSAAASRIFPAHSYGFGSDIELQKGKFSVGFGGTDYGFLFDLGDLPLDTISTDTPEAMFLNTYTPPSKGPDIRAEQSKVFGTPFYEANGFQYKREVPAVAGHSYLLRSINFKRSDVLIALRVYRQDSDGSLIVFWKKLKTFDVPAVDGKN